MPPQRATKSLPPQAANEQESTSPSSATGEGFILKVGGGEALLNGLVVKASPKTGTMGSILVEQTFQRGGTTNLHIHDQGDELFYVVSGRGTATLGEQSEAIEPGDVIFVPRSAVHGISNLEHEDPLTVVFSWTVRSWLKSFARFTLELLQNPIARLRPKRGPPFGIVSVVPGRLIEGVAESFIAAEIPQLLDAFDARDIVQP